jgi:SAM-dependent methyltransferase
MKMDEIWAEALGAISGGRVLDIATGYGNFVQILADELATFDEIVGIDASERAIEAARSAFKGENIRFARMQAEKLDFEDNYFDTVSLSASLHHLTNIPGVLAEAERVLKPGGHFVLAEMHRDGQTEAQLTFIYLHHWAAAVDSALGIAHNPTLARGELLAHVQSLNLDEVRCYDHSDTESDPMDERRIAALDALIERTLERAKEAPDHAVLLQRGEQLCRRLHDLGAQREPILVFTGEKR